MTWLTNYTLLVGAFFNTLFFLVGEYHLSPYFTVPPVYCSEIIGDRFIVTFIGAKIPGEMVPRLMISVILMKTSGNFAGLLKVCCIISQLVVKLGLLLLLLYWHGLQKWPAATPSVSKHSLSLCDISVSTRVPWGTPLLIIRHENGVASLCAHSLATFSLINKGCLQCGLPF